MKIILENFRIVDEDTNTTGAVILDDGIIVDVLPEGSPAISGRAGILINGKNLVCSKNPAEKTQNDLPVLMPAFVDLHAHLRDPGFPGKETLESGSLAAAAGGYGTVVCMANTNPAIDSCEKFLSLKERSDALGIIDLYPVMSLTKGMEGKELSGITELIPAKDLQMNPLMLSEDGKDIADDALFLKAMEQAGRLGIPVSCHCDFGGPEADAQKKAGANRSVWSRMEENNAVRRAIELGRKADCHVHIAHVSTKEAVALIREAKKNSCKSGNGGFELTCEAMPHNICLTQEDADKMGAETFGRVNPPLRTNSDRDALKKALQDGVIDAIATDHAPHTMQDKAAGAPGFSGLETAFAASFTELVMGKSVRGQNRSESAVISLQRLSSLMSANPARLIGLGGPRGRGRIVPGMRADLIIADTQSSWIVEPQLFKTRGKNSAFAGLELFGKILLTINCGKIVYTQP